MRTDYHHLIVGKTPEITDDLSSQSYEFQFEYLDDASLLARSGKVKKGFSILEAHRFTTEARRCKSIFPRVGLRVDRSIYGSQFSTEPTLNFASTASSKLS